MGTYLLPILNELLSSSVTAYATGSAQRYFAQITPDTTVNSTAVQLLARAPQTISPGIAWNMVNLRPYTCVLSIALHSRRRVRLNRPPRWQVVDRAGGDARGKHLPDHLCVSLPFHFAFSVGVAQVRGRFAASSRYVVASRSHRAVR